jgi:hypothetical protein
LLLNKCSYFNPFFSKLNESTQVSFYMSKIINKDVHEDENGIVCILESVS